MTLTTIPHDAALAASIAAAADRLNFNNDAGSFGRYMTLAVFVAALSNRLALGFPMSAAALDALIDSPATPGNPAALSLHQQQ
ncbi:hypothetical protein [Burkholderia ubonensis]|uniref:Uncharacterized protein n=1 Tax=Burkholderia ubonensis TaxID=101571 RepID=A0A107ESF5_9BURK|nr:hypothetical protein [Burkholderia ubonensis]KWD80440.1 hypothetical protein WL71_22825 [Burkholderia ubonensis]KWD86351.1 hypothetical protein WL70_13205 [Burkholderia ubonensis]KWE00204.1 hypothetical protein WL73_19610 [Burkholderia ubonensis]KWE02650.1 hypothetical protein WL72_06470 [Burkholderia ubonensis]